MARQVIVLTKRADDQHETRRPVDEAVGLIVLAAGVFVLVSFVAYQMHSPYRLGGLIGATVAQAMVSTFGFAAYVFPALLLLAGVRLLRTGLVAFSPQELGTGFLLIVWSSALLGLFDRGESPFWGGWFGGFLGHLLAEWCGILGGALLCVAGLAITVVVATGRSLSALAIRWIGRGRETVQELSHAVRQRVQQPHTTLGVRAVPIAVPPVNQAPRRELNTQKEKARKALEEQVPLPLALQGEYCPPPLSLFDHPRHGQQGPDPDRLSGSAKILESKLAMYGVKAAVTAVQPGPVVTTYETEPAPDVRVRRIVELKNDLSLALRGRALRIVAPLPGRQAIGIEVPNEVRQRIYLSEILASNEFQESASTLTIALGKDTVGRPIVADIDRMPHLLIAGTTGSGKSVCLNAMIMSILSRATPSQVRFVMIDPKMLELALYEDIAHQLVPVVTDVKQAIAVLNNLCREMDRRYHLLRDKGVRRLDAYNHLLLQEGDSRTAQVRILEADGAGPIVELGPPRNESKSTGSGDDDEVSILHRPLPKIVVVIDEFGDLIMTAGRQVEEPTIRLAQKARACGIHLVLATQRPSVDVITGRIKANFPARVALKVATRSDSQTILDHSGAEDLIGDGDMLFWAPGLPKPIRVHGAYVGEEEIRRVTDFVKRQGPPEYELEFLESRGEDTPAGEEELDGEDDQLYDNAVRLVTQERIASISYVQRRLRIGYNRAARLVERMEREGVVSRSENGRAREVLAPPPPEE